MTVEESIAAQADEIAKQRTFQHDGATARAIMEIKKGANNYAIRDKWGGSFGAGDLTTPYALAPTNIVVMGAKYSPLGIVNAGKDLARVFIAAKDGTLTPAMQAEAVTNVGRTVTGGVAIALFTWLASAGLLSVAGADDEDKAAMERAQGRTGTQWNLTATVRWANGGSPEWQDGDMLMSIGFLEPINALMAMGALISESYEEDGRLDPEDVVMSSASAVAQSVFDLPALSFFSDAFDRFQYSDAESGGGKVADAALGYLGSQLSSFVIPNAVKGVAAGLDDTVRTSYGDTNLEDVVGSFMYSIPGLRQMLPPALDNFGQERTQTGNTLLNILNNNILPGQLTTFKQSEIESEIERVYEATGSASVYPDRNAPSSIRYGGETYSLDREQKWAYQQAVGEVLVDLLQQLTQTEAYQNASMDERAGLLADANALAEDMAKREMLAAQGVDYTSSQWEKAFQALGLGVEAADYFTYRSALDQLVEDGKTAAQADAAAALLDIDMENELKGELWQMQNSSWSEEKNPYTGTLYRAGISPETSVKIMEKYREIDNATYTGDSVARQKQTAFSQYLDSLGLSDAQRAAVDETYRYWTMFPATPIPYSIETMTDAAQRKWAAAEAWGLTEEEYLRYYPIYSASGEGKTKAAKIAELVAAGMTQAEAEEFWRLMAAS